MASGIERLGDNALKVTLEFPDGKMRQDFEAAFRGWLKEYQHAAATHPLVGALVSKDLTDEGRGDASGGDDQDTSGYLFRYYDAKTGADFYLDFFS